MNVPYFSIITSPVSLIVGCLLLVFIGLFSYLANEMYYLSNKKLSYKKPTKVSLSLWITIPIFSALFLT